jgi:hypothetical protein
VILPLVALLVSVGSLPPAPARAATCTVPGATSRATQAATPGTSAASPAAGASIIQVAEEGTPPIASLPSARSAATPVASGPESIEELARDLNAVADALAACISEGDAETVTLLAGERFLGQIYGSSVPLSREEYIAIASGLTPVRNRIVGVEQIARTADDQATAVVTEVVGNQLMAAEWTFELAPAADRPSGGVRWRVARERELPVTPPSDAANIAVGIDDHAFTLDQTRVKGPDIVLSGTNTGTDDHEMLVLRLAQGYTTEELLRAAGPDLPKEVTFIGELPMRPGAKGTLALVDLEPGVYTLVCLFPNPEGLPYLAEGLEATFTVT